MAAGDRPAARAWFNRALAVATAERDSQAMKELRSLLAAIAAEK